MTIPSNTNDEGKKKYTGCVEIWIGSNGEIQSTRYYDEYQVVQVQLEDGTRVPLDEYLKTHPLGE